ncbi:MAG TPA: tRNA (guanosine(46)-N7)-methyltransferase TrmB [Verrucomicrobiae bacterium]|nr:tRNA (guanosine(46)-N7)-methyltransferase TrmB [Verrucomicrobiae bacterium]
MDRLPLDTMFGAQRPIEVELGAGDGSFLIAYASAHRDINFIGVERLLGRLRKIDRKGQRANLENLRLLRMEASYVAQFLLLPGSAKAFHIYFPDPWPKRRHWKNRLITPGFVEVLKRAMVPGGTVHLRTDDRPYFDQMLEVFSGNPNFEKIHTPPELLRFITDFERSFQERGISRNEVSYRLRAGGR